MALQNNNQNEARDSRTYVKSPVVIQENYNQYTQIQSINGENNNQDTVINQNYIDNHYNNTKENVNCKFITLTKNRNKENNNMKITIIK